MRYTTDTSSEAYSVQLELLRQMTPEQRLRKSMALSAQLKRMAFDAIRRRHPEYDDDAVRLRFIELTYGKVLAEDLKRWKEEQAVGRTGSLGCSAFSDCKVPERAGDSTLCVWKCG